MSDPAAYVLQALLPVQLRRDGTRRSGDDRVR